MYHVLTKREIKSFIRKYMNPYDDYTKEIKTISCIDYNGFTEYLINNKYMLKLRK